LSADGDHLERQLAGAAVQGRGVAVAIETEVVPRSAWVQTRLSAGERVEVLVAVQGG
jgi:sulfur carrier protein